MNAGATRFFLAGIFVLGFALSAPGQDMSPHSKFLPGEWGLSDELYGRILTSVEMGKLFFLSKDREAFLGELGERGAEEEAPVEIGWIVPSGKRYLGTLLSRTPRDIRAMSDAEFETYRRGWNIEAELEHRRFYPLPGVIRGYGTREKREELLRTTRSLIRADGKQDFLDTVKETKGSFSILFVPKGGQGATWYAFSAKEVKALTDSRFITWRGRFLRWIEIHTPGQSLVREFATAEDEEFEAMYAESKDRHGAFDIGRALERFEGRTGVRLAYPKFASKMTAPVVAAVPDGSFATASGLEPGDRVLAVEGTAVPEWNDFIYRVNGYSPGSALEIAVLPRGAKKEEVRYLTLIREDQPQKKR